MRARLRRVRAGGLLRQGERSTDVVKFSNQLERRAKKRTGAAGFDRERGLIRDVIASGEHLPVSRP